MTIGAFSISLSVKDLSLSRDFYTALGFSAFAGDGETFQIMKNGDTLIGLFHGMFDGNVLTFNPGWDQSCGAVEPFEDVRDLQAKYDAAGLNVDIRADPSTTGPAHITLTDPDGNAILIDQHR